MLASVPKEATKEKRYKRKFSFSFGEKRERYFADLVTKVWKE
jgi:hypothetical protein